MTSQGITVEQVRREYPDADDGVVRALDGVDLSVAPGELVAVIGPSGSGKSTLLQVIGALDTPTSGRVRVAGVDLGAMDEEERTTFRREHLGFVFQAFHLIPTMSVVENVALAAVVAGAKRASWLPRAIEVLVLLGIEELANRAPHQLSGGQRQRVAVGRALFGEPDVILAAGPTGNLDSATSTAVLELLRAAVTESDGACGLPRRRRS